MEPIIEAESFMEASVAATNAVLRKSILSTKFVYAEGAKTFEVEVDEDD